jgi:glycosyltransferase involved in cell wall biosynthesis
MAGAEIFFLSLNYEKLSNALFEAMMMGLPWISTCFNGVDEVIVHCYNGCLVPVDSVQKLSDAIIKLIKDKPYSRLLGQNENKSSKRRKAEKIIHI